MGTVTTEALALRRTPFGETSQVAEFMRGQGLDVNVYGVPAYSTLGRFDDPLLSTFIRYPEADFARLIFHELAHQLVYVQDDSSFNESFAVVVEREGLRRTRSRWIREALARLERDPAIRAVRRPR